MLMRAIPERQPILVADDDPELRSFLAGHLRRADLEVLEATDGLTLMSALEDLDERCVLPALVVTDINMPGLNGLQALARIRAQWPELPVVLVTAFATLEIRRTAANLRATRVLHKPIDIDALDQLILALLHERVQQAAV